MASLGLPGLAGFWGEFPAILSTFNPRRGTESVALFRTCMVIASIGTVFAAGYLLWMYQRTAFGSPKEEFDRRTTSTTSHPPEWIAWAPLLVGIVVFGVRAGPDVRHRRPGRAGRHGRLRGQWPVARCRRRRGAAFKSPPKPRLRRARPRDHPHGDARASAIIVDLVLDERSKVWVTRSWASACSGPILPIIYMADQGISGQARVMFGGAYVGRHVRARPEGPAPGRPASSSSCCRSTTSPTATTTRASSPTCSLSSLLGMVVMASARDLITIFVALELLSIPGYLLAGWRKRDTKSNEAALKYYLLGVLASAPDALRHEPGLRGHRRRRSSPRSATALSAAGRRPPRSSPSPSSS